MDSATGTIQRACLFCRKRKLRCDKQLPRCKSCVRLGQQCVYGCHNPPQPRPRTEKSHVHELEERLLRVESLLQVKCAGSDEIRHGPPSDLSREHETVNGSNGITLNAGRIRDLEKTYFETIHPMMPIIHYGRYTASDSLDVGSYPPLYLRYAIWAVAALESKQHSHHSGEYYTRARDLVETAAVMDSLSTQAAVYRAQSWLHLAMYDMITARFALSWAGTSQAIRLLQIAQVHSIDGPILFSGNHGSKNCGWSEAEEMRRAFWFAFCLDRTAFIGQGLPYMIDEQDIRINLPASDKAYQSSAEQPAISLRQATTLGSTYALGHLSATAVIYSLLSSKLKYLEQLDETTVHKLFATNDWLKGDCPHQCLTVEFCVPPYLAVTEANMEANLLYFNVMVHCATIRVHRKAQKLARISSSLLPLDFLRESSSQCLKAASSIFDLAQLASRSNLQTYHPATPFCIHNALVVFADLFLVTQDATLTATITLLVEFMRSLCGHSQVACTLFREFETEYLLLIVELGSKNDAASPTPVAGQPMPQSSRSSVPTQPDLISNLVQKSPVQDDVEEWASCGTESISNDLQEAVTWNPVDMNFTSVFRNELDINWQC